MQSGGEWVQTFQTIELGEALSLQKVADSGQCFRPSDIGGGTFRFISGGTVLDAKQLGARTLSVSCDADIWERVWVPYFDLQRDYTVIRQDIFSRGDALLTEAALYGDGIRVLRQEPFEMLISFILSQRKSIPAIRTAVRALAKTYGDRALAASGDTVFLFPKPEVLAESSEQKLRDLGLGYRAPYVLDAANRVAAGSLNLEALTAFSDEALFAELQTVHGVGKKVANCVMLFGYGRTERVPSDVWVQRIIQAGYRGRDPFAAWQHAGILQQYLFYYALTHKEKFIPRTERVLSSQNKGD